MRSIPREIHRSLYLSKRPRGFVVTHAMRGSREKREGPPLPRRDAYAMLSRALEKFQRIDRCHCRAFFRETARSSPVRARAGPANWCPSIDYRSRPPSSPAELSSSSVSASDSARSSSRIIHKLSSIIITSRSAQRALTYDFRYNRVCIAEFCSLAKLCALI